MRHKSLIKALGGYRSVAKFIKCDPTTVHKWQHRGIPARHWVRLMRLAERHGVPIRPEQLERSAPQRSFRNGS